jgi:hypothetical protein
MFENFNACHVSVILSIIILVIAIVHTITKNKEGFSIWSYTNYKMIMPNKKVYAMVKKTHAEDLGFFGVVENHFTIFILLENKTWKIISDSDNLPRNSGKLTWESDGNDYKLYKDGEFNIILRAN